MRLKPKTVRRLKLLAIIVFLIGGTAFSLFVIRRWQNDRVSQGLRRDGLAALSMGHYGRAMDRLGRFITRGNAQDAEVWLAYAKARAAVEEPDFSNLEGAISAYRQYLSLRPDDEQTRLVLVRLCNQKGHLVEARDAAERLHSADVGHVGPEKLDILREEGISLGLAKMYGDRLDRIVKRVLELQPLDIEGNLLLFESLHQTGRTAEALSAGAALLRAQPEDPAAQLLYAASLLLDPTPENLKSAKAKLEEATGLDHPGSHSYPSDEFVLRAVDIFDRLRAFDQSRRVLLTWGADRAAGSRTANREERTLLRALARRLWQAGRFDDAVKLAPERATETIDTEVLAFVAMSLQRSPDPVQRARADSLITVLRSRTDDFRAEGWAKVLPLTSPSRQPDPLHDSDILRAVVKQNNRNEPVFIVLLGEALAGLSRVDEARQLWSDAAKSPVCSGWSRPSVRIAETLLVEGRPDEASKAATEALVNDPNDAAINALWFEVQTARIQRGSKDGPDPAAMLVTLEKAIDQVEAAEKTPEIRALWERLLAPRIILLARTGHSDHAIAVARTALASEPPLSEQTVIRLASISASERLGIERECIVRAPGKDGVSPAAALSHALALASRGRISEGLEVVRAAAVPGDPQSQLAVAVYLDRTGDAGAKAAWAALSDTFQSDVSIQRECLGASAIAADRDLVERIVNRYQQLSGRTVGGDDAVVRMARARALLFGQPTRKARDEVIGLLVPVVISQPTLIEPKLLLASALRIDNPALDIRPDYARAAEYLTDALALQPRAHGAALELAGILQALHDFGRARDVLKTIARDSIAPSETRRAAAGLLIAQGDVAPDAVEALEEVSKREGDEASAAALADLLGAYALLRQDAKAEGVCDRILSLESPGIEAALRVASYCQLLGLTERRNLAMSLIAKAETPPGAREDALARLAEERGDVTEAVKQYESAVALALANGECWRRYVTLHLSRGEYVSAQAVAQRALTKLPGDRPIQVLLSLARLGASAQGEGLVDFIAAAARGAAQPFTSDMVEAVEEAISKGDLLRASEIGALADRFPQSAPLRVYLAQRLTRMDPSAASQLVSAARNAFPADPSIARCAAEVFSVVERWKDMESAAAAWKSLDPSRSPGPDIAAAQARFGMRDWSGGLAALKPWLDSSLTTPDSPASLSVLHMYARLLVASGRENEARALFAPLLPKSSGVRTAVWLRTVAEAVATLESARTWISQVTPHIPAERSDEQLAIAGTWSALAFRFPAEAPSLLGVARSEAESLAGKAPSAIAWEALGVICHRQRDLDAAQRAYEKSLASDPARSTALNNLASILAEDRDDPLAALPLAKRAIAAAPDDAACFATLGSIQRAMGERLRKQDDPVATEHFKEAASAYRRAAILQHDAESWSRAAQASADCADFAGEADAWQHVLDYPGLSPGQVARVKNNLAMAILAQEPARPLLDRAKSLIDDAISIEDQPSFQDSLGWVELQFGRRERAIEAFRRAIGKDNPAPIRSAIVGLATALASGTPAERNEAAALIRALDTKDLEPGLAAKLRKIQPLVNADK